MAEDEKQEKQDRKSESRSKAKKSDAGSALEEAQEKGYIGPDTEKEYPNEEYALTSGPDSPPYPLGKGGGEK